VESESDSESLEELVDGLLRDSDYLLAQELKQRVDELNALLRQAHGQGLRLTLKSNSASEVKDAEVANLTLKIFKQI
jgi:hypothetical protein